MQSHLLFFRIRVRGQLWIIRAQNVYMHVSLIQKIEGMYMYIHVHTYVIASLHFTTSLTHTANKINCHINTLHYLLMHIQLNIPITICTYILYL